MKKILILLTICVILLYSKGYEDYVLPELYKSVEKRNYKRVIKLLEQGNSPCEYVWINAKEGRTILSFVSIFSDIEMIKIFLPYINDISKPQCGTWPLLFPATQNEDKKIIKFLVDNGADINFRSKLNQKSTAIEFAFLYEKFTSAQYLLELGAKLNDEDGIKLLKHGVKSLKIKSLEFLIKNKINLNYQDKDGNTIMHFIAMNEIEKSIEFTIKYIKNAEHIKKFPNHYIMLENRINQIKSRWSNYQKIVNLLIDNGINLKLKNNQGKTALKLAKEYKNEIVLSYIK